MNSSRAMHNANVLGNWLYVFGGIKDNTHQLQLGIERLDLGQGGVSGGQVWEYMAVTPRSGIPLRFNDLCATLNQDELVVLGGMNTEVMLEDGYVLYPKSKTIKLVR